MTIQAVIFDRDGVLTYFDTRVVMTSLLSILPLSVEELTERWWAWEHEHGVPTDAEEEARMFTLFWERLADELSLSAAQRENSNNSTIPPSSAPTPTRDQRWRRPRRTGCA